MLVKCCGFLTNSCCCADSLKLALVMAHLHASPQVLGRNLEGLVTRAQEVKSEWRDEFVSVEHMLLAFVDDTKFGTQLLKDANLDKAKIEAAVKDIRGSNRVTDQVTHSLYCLLSPSLLFTVSRSFTVLATLVATS